MGIRGPGKSVTIATPLESISRDFHCALRVKKWFADVEMVKKMYTAITSQLTIQNEEEILAGYFESDLDFGNIQEDSERIKLRKRALGPDSITFTDDSWQNLSYDDIIKGTVVVTDTSEGIELIEGVDYQIDYTSGKIRRIINFSNEGDASGASAGESSVITGFPVSLSVENSVTVHYEYYMAVVKNVDYSINYERGSLSRKEGGSLVSGSKVYIDYKIRELVQD
ncbi:hypothetical protein ACFL67_03600, partial [candidate division KSB1 bacterium]